MTITITRLEKTITIETTDSSLENIIDEFMLCLLALEFEPIEIKKEFDKVHKIINNKE
jgi:hypothetical protein